MKYFKILFLFLLTMLSCKTAQPQIYDFTTNVPCTAKQAEQAFSAILGGSGDEEWMHWRNSVLQLATDAFKKTKQANESDADAFMAGLLIIRRELEAALKLAE